MPSTERFYLKEHEPWVGVRIYKIGGYPPSHCQCCESTPPCTPLVKGSPPLGPRACPVYPLELGVYSLVFASDKWTPAGDPGGIH